jgi:hypothetical protein
MKLESKGIPFQFEPESIRRGNVRPHWLATDKSHFRTNRAATFFLASRQKPAVIINVGRHAQSYHGGAGISPMDHAREKKLRAMAARQGLILGVSRRSDRYILFEDPSRAMPELAPTHGSPRSPWDVSEIGYEGNADEIESYLARGEMRLAQSAEQERLGLTKQAAE